MGNFEAYRLSHEIRQLMASIGESGELTPETELLLNDLAKDRDKLFESLGIAIREHNLASVALRSEIAWLTQGARRHEEAGSNIRAYVLNALKTFGMRAVTTSIQNLVICASPPKVIVPVDLDLDNVDDKFIVLSRTLSKDAIKEAAKHGEELPAGVRIEQGEHVKVTPR